MVPESLRFSEIRGIFGESRAIYIPGYSVLESPATVEEVRETSVQFARKINCFREPSKANESVFLAAVDEIAATSELLSTCSY